MYLPASSPAEQRRRSSFLLHIVHKPDSRCLISSSQLSQDGRAGDILDLPTKGACPSLYSSRCGWNNPWRRAAAPDIRPYEVGLALAVMSQLTS